MSTAKVPNLPATHRALVLTSKSEPLSVQTLPVPEVTRGSAIIRVLAAPIITYMGEVYSDTPPRDMYGLPMPMIPGTSAIGRVAAVGADATVVQPGQLVLVDCMIRGRDDPSAIFLAGLSDGFTENSKKLMRNAWRDSTYAEYARVPLETCTVLDEARLLGSPDQGGLGLSVEMLCDIPRLLVGFGGLRDINVVAGETVVIAPATGPFGSGAVQCAVGMGARVIAMGRNERVLANLESMSERISTGKMTGDIKADAAALKAKARGGIIDAFFEIAPPQAAGSNHFMTGISVLRQGGRISLMGGWGDMTISPYEMIGKNLKLFGKWMYEPEDIRFFVRMLEAGDMPIGPRFGAKVVAHYKLEEWEQAFAGAAKANEPGMISVFIP